MLPASRRSIALARPLRRSGVNQINAIRRYASEVAPQSAAEASLNLPPKKKRGFVRRVVTYTTLFGTVFYAGSTAVALVNDRYRDFFVESVPLGETIMDYAEQNGWDDVALKGAVQQGVSLTRTAYQSVSGAVSRTFGSGSTSGNVKSAVEEASKDIPKAVSKSVDKVVAVSTSVTDAVKSKGFQVSEDIRDLVAKAEAALKNGSSVVLPTPPPTSVPAVVAVDNSPRKDVVYVPPVPGPAPQIYDAPLPIGFEPPPGYTRPSPQKAKKTKSKTDTPSALPVQAAPAPPPLPLVAPAVSELSSSEPVIAQIASSIDGLAAYLNNNPTATKGAKDILENAQIDLIQLGNRIEQVKSEEKKKLEEALEERAKEYSSKLLELEIDAQDKIDAQEEGHKAMVEDQRRSVVAAYREKLSAELETQSQIINERLKEEVIAQGIEMQRRWIREIKVRVEQERGGRLAKLEDLATGLKKLERVTLDNSAYLDENLRLHTLWSALRAFNSAVDSPVRRPFREELRILRNVAAARDDPVITAALDSIETSDVPDIGVEPLLDLVSWFTSSVAPRVEAVALVPDQNAGVLSHLASSALSSFRFKRQGLVDGNDVASVVARAEHYLTEKDLDSAARELNQLKGVPKVLLSDWLAAARKRLEVQQALSVVQSQATLASLLVV